MTLQIFIPSRARPDRKRHFAAETLKAAGIPFTIVRTLGDESVYPADYPQIWVEATYISDKRQRLVEMFTEKPGKFVMIDDDLSFRRVITDGIDTTTEEATLNNIREIIRLTDMYLDQYPIVGIHQRFMIQEAPQPYSINGGKMIQYLAYNTELFDIPKPWPVANRLSSSSDVDFTMQLQYEGLSRLMITEFCLQEKLKHNADGGCSLWRNDDLERENYKKLAAFWPDHVVHTSDYPPRHRIMWKKIAEDGQLRKKGRSS